MTQQNAAAGGVCEAPSIRRIAVIGAGTAGRRGFALAVAGAGFDVVLEDVMPANLRKAEADYSDITQRAGPSTNSGSLAFALTVEDAVRDADLAIDFVPDELESKLEIFSLIDRMAPPRTVLCTPSDALSITDLASCVYRPERCFALRGSLVPSSPSPLRLLYPAASSQAVVEVTATFLQALGLIVTTEVDPDAPMLMKNLATRVPTV